MKGSSPPKHILSILLTSYKTLVLQTNLNDSFTRALGMVLAYSIHPNPDCTASGCSELSLSQPPQFKLLFPPRYMQTKLLISTFKVCLDFLAEEDYTENSLLLGTGIHEGAWFASLLNKLCHFRDVYNSL